MSTGGRAAVLRSPLCGFSPLDSASDMPMTVATPRDESREWTDEILSILGVLLDVPIGMFVVSSLVIGLPVALAECIFATKQLHNLVVVFLTIR